MTKARRQTARLALLAGLLLAGGGFAAWQLMRPGDPARYRSVAQAIEQRDFERASSELAEWKRAGGSGPGYDLLAGTVALRQGRLDEALAIFSVLPPEGPHREAVLQVTGDCLHRLGRLAEARSVLIPLTQEFPQNAEGHRSLAGLYYDLGANDDALLELDALKRLVPEDYRPYHLAARIYADFQRYDEAIQNGEEALRRNPSAEAESGVRECLAVSYTATQHPERALDVLQPVAKTTVSLALEAEALLALGRFDEARERIAEARLLDPKAFEPRSLEARLAFEEGKTDAAIELLETLLKDAPHEYKDRYRLAMAYRRDGNAEESDRQLKQFEASQALYRQLSDLNTQAIQEPHNAEVRRKLADLCRTLGKPELAAVWDQAARSVSQP